MKRNHLDTCLWCLGVGRANLNSANFCSNCLGSGRAYVLDVVDVGDHPDPMLVSMGVVDTDGEPMDDMCSHWIRYGSTSGYRPATE